jgi:hypothetical protein
VKTPVVWFKVCPVLLTTVAVLPSVHLPPAC